MTGFGNSVCVNHGALCNEPQKLGPLLTIFQVNCIQWCRLQIQYLINKADGLKQEEIIHLTPYGVKGKPVYKGFSHHGNIACAYIAQVTVFSADVSLVVMKLSAVSQQKTVR